ncbi:MAG: phosphoribosylformylglycinamidine cyclo-ligase [Rickettsiales bacterium]
MKRKNNRTATARKGATYASAGVSIDAGNKLVEAIKPYCRKTSRPGVMAGLGGFGALFDLKDAGYKDPILVSGTDGVGTKIKVALEMDDFSTIGEDLVAMCVNDLVVQGAESLFFLDYYACGALDVGKAAETVKGIAKGCQLAGCALVGGETAEMPGLYQKGDIDLAGFAVGAVERKKILPLLHKMKEGDVLLGLASSGFHSNGFSLVRKLLSDNRIDFDSKPPKELKASVKTVGGLLLTPTRIYVKSCLAAIKKIPSIRGFAHITGGGLTENIPRVLPEHLAASIDLGSWKLPKLFAWIQSLGNVEEKEMLRAFNCGIGMVVVVSKKDAPAAIKTFTKHGETVYTLGALVKRKKASVVYHGTLSA